MLLDEFTMGIETRDMDLDEDTMDELCDIAYDFELDVKSFAEALLKTSAAYQRLNSECRLTFS